MIKFIAADLDGTLLNENKELPHDFGEVLDKLNNIGVRFAIASGRQYDTVRRQFDKYADKLTFIVENGGLVAENDKFLFCDPMSEKDAAEVLETADGEKGLFPIACCAEGAFGSRENTEHIDNVTEYYINYRAVDDAIGELKGKRILKIAVYDDDLSENHCYPLLRKFEDRCNVFVSGDHWLDVMKKGVTKGTAIEKILDIYGYSPDECMAFGDFMNDADMMRVCRHSYAMENAHPALKALCRFTAPSNEDEGVTRVIKEVFRL